MSSINSDFKILRKQVDTNDFSDKELKELFQKNKYDIVSTLLEIENFVEMGVEKTEQSEAKQKIAELREIANEKDKIIGYIRDNFSS